MERPIQVGDLVYVYRDCCGKYLGIYFTVGAVYFSPGICTHCHKLFVKKMAQPKEKSNLNFVPVEWLKRVPPLTDLEGELSGVPTRVPEEVLILNP